MSLQAFKTATAPVHSGRICQDTKVYTHSIVHLRWPSDHYSMHTGWPDVCMSLPTATGLVQSLYSSDGTMSHGATTTRVCRLYRLFVHGIATRTTIIRLTGPLSLAAHVLTAGQHAATSLRLSPSARWPRRANLVPWRLGHPPPPRQPSSSGTSMGSVRPRSPAPNKHTAVQP